MKSKFTLYLLSLFVCQAALSDNYECIFSIQGKEIPFIAETSNTPYDLGDYAVTMPPCGYALLEEKSSHISVSAYDLTYLPKEVFLSLSTPNSQSFLSCNLK